MRSAVFIGLMLLVGCTSTRTYSVVVRNDSLQPMTLWLTKDGPPAELGWLSPEQLDRSGLAKNWPTDELGKVVPPGKVAELRPIEGHFDSGTSAVLRIYHGQLTFDHILAISQGSPNRADMMLEPGDNRIRIDKDGNAFK